MEEIGSGSLLGEGDNGLDGVGKVDVSQASMSMLEVGLGGSSCLVGASGSVG